MREIKFRAWNKKDKKFVYFVLLQNKFSNDMENFSKNGFDCEPWEQFTGLKDMIGRDIFEGDVLEMDEWEPKHMTVAFAEGGFCMKTRTTQKAMLTDINFIQDSKGIHARVVGNTHQNPELCPK